MQAYRRYGVTKGTILTAWRLLRCNPFGKCLHMIEEFGNNESRDREIDHYMACYLFAKTDC